MSILFLACLLAICLPILSVQLPRFLPTPPYLNPHLHPYFPHVQTSLRRHRSDTLAENRSTVPERTPPLRRRLRRRRPASAERNGAQHGGGQATDGANSGAPQSTGEETGDEEIHIQPQSHSVAASGLLNATAARPDKGAMGEKAGGRGRAEHMAPRRKPWDPPFGKRREAGFEPLQTSAHVMENDWFVSSPAPPKKTGRELEAKGVARRLFPPEAEGTCAHDYEAHDGLVGFDRDATPRATPIPISESAPATGERVYMDDTKSTSSKKGRNKPGIISAVWMSVGICAVLLFILAFAILVAHCLAWFLVYKTEARLGEARRGIMQGGDMRLCLCAT